MDANEKQIRRYVRKLLSESLVDETDNNEIIEPNQELEEHKPITSHEFKSKDVPCES